MNNIITRFYEWSFNNNIDSLIADIRQFSPDLIGVSFMSYHYIETYKYIKILSRLNIPIVCGGAHINSSGSKVLSEISADFLIKGEGEKALLYLINNLDNHEKYRKIQGLVYRLDNMVVENEAVPLDIEPLPFPKYEEFDLHKYEKHILIQTSRGCPYMCTFCQQSALLGKKWRGRSPEEIIKELEYWAALGIDTFDFADDNLTLDKSRMQHLCNLIQHSKYTYNIYTSGVRIDNVDLALLESMKNVGFSYLSFGIESGSERILKEIRKGITLSQIHNTLEISCKLGFRVKLYFIINNRTETYQDVHASFELARQYPIEIARFTNLVPYPNTYDYEWIQRNGRFIYSSDEYLNNPNRYLDKPLYDGPGMSLVERKQIIKESKQELQRFYPAANNLSMFQKLRNYFTHHIRNLGNAYHIK
jgi:radical SAM superfamily enzyme YgiQ (UPF0313 family)